MREQYLSQGEGITFEAKQTTSEANNVCIDGKRLGSLQWPSDRRHILFIDPSLRERIIPFESLDRLSDMAHRVDGTPTLYELGVMEGIGIGWDRHVRATEKPVETPTPDELGEAEKIRLVNKLLELELPYDEALVIERTEPVKDGDQPISYVTEVAVGLDGIKRFLRMRFDAIGPELFTLSSTPIAAKDYPQYLELADKTIAAYAKAKLPK